MTQAESANWFVNFFTCWGFFMLIIIGHATEFYERLFGAQDKTAKAQNSPEGYPTFVSDFEYFFTKRLYGRIRDCWNRFISKSKYPLIYIFKNK